MARDYGVTVEEMRAILLRATFVQAVDRDPQSNQMDDSQQGEEGNANE